MTRIDDTDNRATGHLEGLVRFFGLNPGPGQCDDAGLGSEPTVSPSGQCEYGGYNEAFVMQHWANYDPIR